MAAAFMDDPGLRANPLRLSLEPEAQALVEASEVIPYLYTVPPPAKRLVLEELQSRPTPRPPVDEEWIVVDGGPTGDVKVRLVRPAGSTGQLPVVLYVHGGGWVMGNAATHDRLVSELAVGAGVAIAFPEYDLAPERTFPVALEQCYAVAAWIAAEGDEVALDAGRLGVAGDQMGGTIAIGTTMLARDRGGPEVQAMALLYPATDAGFDTESYRLFEVGYSLRAEGFRDFWNLYCPDLEIRNTPHASPLRASLEQLGTLPPTLVVTAEADCLRDEGEAFAATLRLAGVPVLSTRYQGITNGFMMLDAMRGTMAAEAAIAQTAWFLGRLHESE